jgi:hypothetical protein
MQYLILFYYYVILGLIYISDERHKEIHDLLDNSIRTNTTKSYDSHIKEWTSFIGDEGLMNDDFYHLNDEDFLTILLLYTVHLFKLHRVVNLL